MKSLTITLALCCSLMFVQAAPAAQTEEEFEQQSLQQCNATTPVQRNPQFVIASSVATGEFITLNHDEQCVLLCFLQKIKLLNENGNIRNGTSVVKYVLSKSPELAKYVEVLISKLYTIGRFAKGFQDKCVRAQIIYHELANEIFTLSVAESLQELTGVKDEVVNAIENGQSVDPDLSKQVKEYLQFFDVLIKAFAKEATNPQAQQSKIVV